MVAKVAPQRAMNGAARGPRARSLGGSAKRVLARASAPIGSVVGVRTQAPLVVLTYDDGPHPEGTTAVLQALAAHGATATFFMLLTRVRRAPDLAREVAAAGHEVGLHGTDHRALTSLPPRAVAARLHAGRAELEDVVGAPVRWLRPPYGRQTVATWRAAAGAGLTPVMWGPSLRDSQSIGDEERLAGALARIDRGSIVLCHDNYADAVDGVDDGPVPTVDRGALAGRLLAALGERGLRGVSLDAALGAGRLDRRAWFGR